MLTQDQLKELLHYEPATGVFTWRKNRTKSALAGTKAGTATKGGYVAIKVYGRRYTAHRLAWLYCYGKWPQKGIDHKDGDPANNQLSNLREADQSQNNQNARKARSNTSGYKGVTRTDYGTWKASIMLNRRIKYLGSFKTPEEAYKAYLAAKPIYHPFQPTDRA